MLLILLACLVFYSCRKNTLEEEQEQEEMSASPLPNAKYGAPLEVLARRS